MTKKQFLKDVMHEIDMLRQHATEEEKGRLNIEEFNPLNERYCLYGQLTTDCSNERAKKLMNVSCIRVMDVEDGVNDIKGCNISDRRFKVNGEYTGQTWNTYYGRRYRYLSALEGYICTKKANIQGIMHYIKGNTDTLNL